MAAQVVDRDSTLIKVAPDVPPLLIFSGKVKLDLPTNQDEWLPDSWITLQESGSMTKEIFERYLCQMIVPYCEKSVPGPNRSC